MLRKIIGIWPGRWYGAWRSHVPTGSFFSSHSCQIWGRNVCEKSRSPLWNARLAASLSLKMGWMMYAGEGRLPNALWPQYLSSRISATRCALKSKILYGPEPTGLVSTYSSSEPPLASTPLQMCWGRIHTVARKWRTWPGFRLSLLSEIWTVWSSFLVTSVTYCQNCE